MACTFFECIKILTDDEKNRLCQQFEKYIVKNGDCHLWQGRLDACGYGEIRLTHKFESAPGCICYVPARCLPDVS